VDQGTFGLLAHRRFSFSARMNLSRLEKGLLAYLSANTGRILSREEMAANIWKLKMHPRSRTIDQTVANVRRKSGSRIVSHFGRGYEFRPGDIGG